MHTVFDVAKYVLNKCGPMTTMKLQKLVYYCQSWSLAWDDIPLFDEDFQAWANGPVCPELFSKHKGMFRVTENLFSEYDCKFAKDEIETMDGVLDAFGAKSPQWLINLTHSERPWKEARGGTPLGMPCSEIITKESMQDYYGGLAANGE